MAVKQIITEKLLKEMIDSIDKEYYINYNDEDLYIVLATPHSYYFKKSLDKCFRIRVKDAWFSISASTLKNSSLEDINTALSINLMEYKHSV